MPRDVYMVLSWVQLTVVMNSLVGGCYFSSPNISASLLSEGYQRFAFPSVHMMCRAMSVVLVSELWEEVIPISLYLLIQDLLSFLSQPACHLRWWLLQQPGILSWLLRTDYVHVHEQEIYLCYFKPLIFGGCYCTSVSWPVQMIELT